jgi:hypothetical protein
MQVNTLDQALLNRIMLVSCMPLFTKHNYRAKKLNYLTLKCSTQREQGLFQIFLGDVRIL